MVAGRFDRAGDTIARGGFDPILALFNPSGVRINQNDNGDGLVAADSLTGAHFDTFLTSVLAAGNYTVSVSEYNNFAGATLATPSQVQRQAAGLMRLATHVTVHGRSTS